MMVICLANTYILETHYSSCQQVDMILYYTQMCYGICQYQSSQGTKNETVHSNGSICSIPSIEKGVHLNDNESIRFGIGMVGWLSANVSTGILASREWGISTSTGRSGGEPMLMLYGLAETDH